MRFIFCGTYYIYICIYLFLFEPTRVFNQPSVGYYNSGLSVTYALPSVIVPRGLGGGEKLPDLKLEIKMQFCRMRDINNEVVSPIPNKQRRYPSQVAQFFYFLAVWSENKLKSAVGRAAS